MPSSIIVRIAARAAAAPCTRIFHAADAVVQASELATLELGPVTEIEQRRKLMAEIDQDRLTRIDRAMITGPGGGGKSTLARKISQQWGIPLYPLDDIHWIRDPAGDRRRQMDDKLIMLAKIVSGDAWVIEGVQFKWADMALDRADKIIVLDTPFLRNQVQIVRRFVRQINGTEKADYKPTFWTLMRIFRWSADYRSYERAMLTDKLQPLLSKTHVVRSIKDGLSVIAGTGGAMPTVQVGPA